MRGVLLPSEPTSQYRWMSLSKTDDDDDDNDDDIDDDNDDDDDDDERTHENDAKTLSWHTVNASLWTGASYDGNNSSHLFWNLEDPVLVQRLSHTRGSKWLTVEEENNLPPITYSLFSWTYFNLRRWA